MTNPNIQVDDLVREMTDEEYARYQIVMAEVSERQAQQEAKAASRESALAKLKALGLTEAEIASL
jgi:DNA-binding NarL/FixJ family response regulator